MRTSEYCRAIESYLCQKNDGHLIRVVGPAFELVSRWADAGVPLKVAFRGIDRHFERYYRKGPRRRPVRIDFCEADILDVFDEWRRALGLPAATASAERGETPEVESPPELVDRRGPSLPAHLERVLERLTGARATGRLDARSDALIDRIAHELDLARSTARGLRGDARRALLDRLAAVDLELVRAARAGLDERTRRELEDEADAELAAYRITMQPDVFQRAREAAIDRLVRERLMLPAITLSSRS